MMSDGDNLPSMDSGVGNYGSMIQNSSEDKKKRAHLPASAVAILKQSLFNHVGFPYPADQDKLALATETGLTVLQANNWYVLMMEKKKYGRFIFVVAVYCRVAPTTSVECSKSLVAIFPCAYVNRPSICFLHIRVWGLYHCATRIYTVPFNVEYILFACLNI